MRLVDDCGVEKGKSHAGHIEHIRNKYICKCDNPKCAFKFDLWEFMADAYKQLRDHQELTNLLRTGRMTFYGGFNGITRR